MQIINQTDAFKLICLHTRKYGLYVNFWGETDGIIKAAPYLDPKINDTLQILCDGSGILLFDTEEEREKHYYSTVGDDGPTKYNKYSGPGRVYALTCDPDGQTKNENT